MPAFDAPALPQFTPLGDGRVCVHATAVAFGGAGILILGPSGAGKSGTAAQLLAIGAELVADDLVIVSVGPDGLAVSAPAGAPAAMELHGFGVVVVPVRGPARLRAALWLGPTAARMPRPESLVILGTPVPLARHPTSVDLAAKVALWLRCAP